MSIVSVLILVVVVISIVWAFKTGYIKALSEGYVFSFTEGAAEDGSLIPVLKLEQGYWNRKFVAASPVSWNIPISKKQVSHFLSTNREGYGQRLIPLMKAVQQRKQEMVDPLYNVAAAQQTGNAFWQAAEQVQEELEKAYRRVDYISSGAVEGVGGALALRDIREHRTEFDNVLTLSSVRRLGMAAQDLGLLSRNVRQEIMKYVDDTKLEQKLRRRQKQATVWVYPLDSQWAWDDSLNHRKSQDKD